MCCFVSVCVVLGMLVSMHILCRVLFFSVGGVVREREGGGGGGRYLDLEYISEVAEEEKRVSERRRKKKL